MSDEFDNAFSDLYTTHPEAQSATYTPRVGAPVSCTVFLDTETEYEPEGYQSQVWGSVKSIEYRLSEVGGEADEGDKFTIGSTDYTVIGVLENDGRFCKCLVR